MKNWSTVSHGTGRQTSLSQDTRNNLIRWFSADPKKGVFWLPWYECIYASFWFISCSIASFSGCVSFGNEDSALLFSWPPDVKSWLIGKDADAGKDWRQEEKGTTEDEMVGWHQWPMEMSLGELWELAMDREAWHAVVRGSWKVRRDWVTELNWTERIHIQEPIHCKVQTGVCKFLDTMSYYKVIAIKTCVIDMVKHGTVENGQKMIHLFKKIWLWCFKSV